MGRQAGGGGGGTDQQTGRTVRQGTGHAITPNKKIIFLTSQASQFFRNSLSSRLTCKSVCFVVYVTARCEESSFSVSECVFVCDVEELCVIEMCRNREKIFLIQVARRSKLFFIDNFCRHIIR